MNSPDCRAYARCYVCILLLSLGLLYLSYLAPSAKPLQSPFPCFICLYFLLHLPPLLPCSICLPFIHAASPSTSLPYIPPFSTSLPYLLHFPASPSPLPLPCPICLHFYASTASISQPLLFFQLLSSPDLPPSQSYITRLAFPVSVSLTTSSDSPRLHQLTASLNLHHQIHSTYSQSPLQFHLLPF